MAETKEKTKPKTRRTASPKTQRTVRGSRLGKVHPDNWDKPVPLRFRTLEDAKKHIKANKFKVLGHESHTRGERIHVQDRKTGKVRTISIARNKDGNDKD